MFTVDVVEINFIIIIIVRFKIQELVVVRLKIHKKNFFKHLYCTASNKIGKKHHMHTRNINISPNALLKQFA